jgi:SAM-dependent MidA family methyltransferase
MALCLGHPLHGYYRTRDPLGAAGDFVTAPEKLGQEGRRAHAERASASGSSASRRGRGRVAPVTARTTMALCLGHPLHGYYRTRDPLGAAGDFVTAPEISQICSARR